MDALYTLFARRRPDVTDGLKVRYPSKELALAAAAVIKDQWPVVSVFGPDGDLLMESTQSA